MNFRVATSKNEDGSTEIYFIGIEHWNDFDLLLQLLQQESGCELLNNQTMVYVRRAQLKQNGVTFELIQDDMLGNYLYTDDDKSVPILKQLAIDVIHSIKTKIASKRK